jgi:hypothetical protein
MVWQPEALERLQRAPFFVRPFIKMRAETEAKKRGYSQVTTQLLDELKASEHRG